MIRNKFWYLNCHTLSKYECVVLLHKLLSNKDKNIDHNDCNSSSLVEMIEDESNSRTLANEKSKENSTSNNMAMAAKMKEMIFAPELDQVASKH